MPQNRTRPVDRYNTLLRNTFVGLHSEFPPKHAPEQVPISFTLPDRHLRIQGQFFAGKTLLAPVEEGYKREEILILQLSNLTAYMKHTARSAERKPPRYSFNTRSE